MIIKIVLTSLGVLLFSGWAWAAIERETERGKRALLKHFRDRARPKLKTNE